MKAITEEDKLHTGWYEEAEKIKTPEELKQFVAHLCNDYGHDYGTICHAVAAAALAAAWCVDKSEHGGITGFQASAAFLEFTREWNGVKGPARLLKYEDMLYPQYLEKFTTISPKTFDWLKKRASELLGEKDRPAHPDVRKHWESIVRGEVPFGYKVNDL